MKPLFALLCFAASLLGFAPFARAADDFSPAERLLFMSNQLAKVEAPATLHYHYLKSGSLEPGFEDQVSVSVRRRPDGGCCAAGGEFLSGARRLALPEVEQAEGNPVLLYFLERDIREMSRLTKGQPNYFRKRIRMAVYDGAQITEVSVPYRGHEVAARRITIAPYLDDPLRSRFENLATKRYDFTLSDAVPGEVVSIAAHVDGRDGAGPVLLEQVVIDGADARPQP